MHKSTAEAKVIVEKVKKKWERENNGSANTSSSNNNSIIGHSQSFSVCLGANKDDDNAKMVAMASVGKEGAKS